MEKKNLPNGRIAFIVACIIECILAIPIIGGSVVLLSGWTILLIALLVHVVALIFARKDMLPAHAPVIGIIASVLGFVPFLGWALHVVAALMYIISLLGKRVGSEKTVEESNDATDSTVKDAEIVEDNDEPSKEESDANEEERQSTPEPARA